MSIHNRSSYYSHSSDLKAQRIPEDMRCFYSNESILNIGET